MSHTRRKPTIPWGSPRGGAMLFGLMTLSAALLLYLGSITTVLNEQVTLSGIQQAARAAELAHAGIEYAFWEINHDNNDFTGWTENPTKVYQRSLSLQGGAPTVVTVDKTADPSWTIKSTGSVIGVSRTAQVNVSGGSGPANPGLFDHGIYTQGGDRLDANVYLSKNSLIDAYNSDNGSYGGANILKDQVIVRTDSKPARNSSWAVAGGEQTDGPIVLDGDSTVRAKVYGKLRLRDLDAAELPLIGEETEPSHICFPSGTCTKDENGTPGVVDANDNGVIDIIDGADGVSSSAVGYSAKDGLDPGTTAFNVTSTTRICPGQSRQYNQVNVTGATLVIGCTNNSSDPDYSIARCDTLCGGADPNLKVTVATGGGATTSYPFRVWCSGGGCNSTTGQGGTAGRVLVFSPLDLFYAPDAGGEGLTVSSNGIVNRIPKGTTYDPAKLAIYGGEFGTEDNTTWRATAPFYGVVFSPLSKWSFANASAVDFYGALNVKRINTQTSTLKLHWDTRLPVAYPGTGGGGGGGGCTPPNCRPVAGSWTLSNY